MPTGNGLRFTIGSGPAKHDRLGGAELPGSKKYLLA